MNLFKGKQILITAGPTREYIDPVRYISNDSSGRMGYALAEAAKAMGAKVTLISGPTHLLHPKGVKTISVITAREMYRSALEHYKKADIIICAAAVADFRPARQSKRKIKKGEERGTPAKGWSASGGKDELTISFTQNPDILKTLGKRKRSDQLLIGFALETEHILKNAMKKLQEKQCDMIVSNHATNISAETGSVILLDHQKRCRHIIGKKKKAIAKEILNAAIDLKS